MIDLKTLSVAHAHSIKKFELIERYIKGWAPKLLCGTTCDTLVYIDCMCNSGLYLDEEGQIVKGTAIRVAEALEDVARTHKDKNIVMYLNDIKQSKIDQLRLVLPKNSSNFRIHTEVGDAGDFLRDLAPLLPLDHLHYFLLYDPYDASIDWDALEPYFREWGEVLINHMVSDSVRAIKVVKRESTKKKYETTYREKFEELAPYGSNKESYEKRIEEIIQYLSGNQNYYVAAFPFYNSKNSIVYNLVHGTKHVRGFSLYKESAWKVFKGFSSTRRSPGAMRQLGLNFEDSSENPTPIIEADESCYGTIDMASYINKKFSGMKNVPEEKVWKILEYHPIFPPKGFRRDVVKHLKEIFHAKFDTKTKTVSFF